MKRLIYLIIVAALLTVCGSALADPARTDGTVTAWIGEDNHFFIKCSDGVTRKLSTPMADILGLNETDAVGLTQANQIIAVRKDGTQYRILAENATEAEIEAQRTEVFKIENEKLTVGGEVFSERAVVAVTDGIVLYWVNRNQNGFVLMHKALPGKETEAIGRAAASLTGVSVPEPLYLCVTGETLTLTAKTRSITAYALQNGMPRLFPASGQETESACLTGDRLYRYTKDLNSAWILEEIGNNAMQLVTVTPAPTASVTPTPVPTATPRPTTVPTATPRVTPKPTPYYPEDDNIYKGARGSTVRRIQQRLFDLGYPVGYVDGAYGEQTQIALNLFYDMLHMRERNYISASTRRKLFAANAPIYDPYMPLQRGDQGLCVLYMQMMLRKLGYDVGRLDGIYGIQTVFAMAEYQKLIGYKPAEKEVPGEYAAREVLERLFGPEPTPTVASDGTTADNNNENAGGNNGNNSNDNEDAGGNSNGNENAGGNNGSNNENENAGGNNGGNNENENAGSNNGSNNENENAGGNNGSNNNSNDNTGNNNNSENVNGSNDDDNEDDKEDGKENGGDNNNNVTGVTDGQGSTNDQTSSDDQIQNEPTTPEGESSNGNDDGDITEPKDEGGTGDGSGNDGNGGGE